MIINESLKGARKKYKGLIDIDTFAKFANADFSKSYKYVEKICEIFYNNDIEADEVISIFLEYQDLEKYIIGVDITKLSLDEILDVIDDAKIKKMTSNSVKRKTLKNKSLIYENDYARVYHIKTFNDCEIHGKGTGWCIALNRSQFNLYNNEYDIYVIYDLKRDVTDKFRKVCYLINDDNEMIVDSNNIHYFSDRKDYNDIKNKLIPKLHISQGGDMRM